MNTKINEPEILDFLINIEEGKIILTSTEYDPQYIYAGNVSYKASNNWTIVIFNDANEWDCIDCIRTDDERGINFAQIELLPVAGKYYPSVEVSWARYGIPGHCKFRCRRCGCWLKPPINWHESSKIYLCVCDQCFEGLVEDEL